MKDQDSITKDQDLVRDEISLLVLAKTLWNGRHTLIITVIIFILVGLSLALFSKKEYTVSTIMVPQIENATPQLGGLSSLASLAGVNMNMNAGNNVISPMLYPIIISSTDFQLELMNSEFQFEELDSTISLLDYYINIYRPGLLGTLREYTIGLPGHLISTIRGNQLDKQSGSESDLVRISQDQDEVRKIIEESLTLDVNDKDGYIKLVSRFHQAYLSAQVAQKAQQQLQEYVTKFKIEKASDQLEFIKGRYEESKGEFEKAQDVLAAFRDENKNISSEIMRTQEERLQNEYQLAFDVYSELAKQLEQAKIKVAENTPVFSIIKQVVVPIEKSKPKRAMILIIWLLLGCCVGIGVVFWKNFISAFKKRWNASSS